MKKVFLLIIFLTANTVQSQEEMDLKVLIGSINSQIDTDIAQSKFKNLSIRRISQTPDNKDFPTKLLTVKIGDILDSGDGKYYRLLSKSETKEFKVKYIFIDGDKLDLSELNELKAQINKEYYADIPFAQIADKYSMDPRKNGGDLGWFPEGRMVRPFEDAVKNHKKGEIFTAEFKPKNWHFVIFKNHDDREAGELEYIEIQPLKFSKTIDSSLSKKQISVLISYMRTKDGELTKVSIDNLRCVNCTLEDDYTNQIESIISRCFDKIKESSNISQIDLARVNVKTLNFDLE
ncbi:MAG: peptidylprolyl isomerase [Aequorivita sp.]|nr:peptidylprolyl isomerase [Aequorivita sp.]